MQKRSDQDAAHHQQLVSELVALFVDSGFLVSSADGVAGYFPTLELPNDGYGDQEDKAPDVYAYDPATERYVIGEAKTGIGDLETEHALTQYNVFLDQYHHRTGNRSRVYFIVPSAFVAEFNTLITHYIHRELWGEVVVVRGKDNC